MASHIQTIEQRNYVSKQGDKFCPTNLGIALVLGFEMVDLNLQKPFLRAQVPPLYMFRSHPLVTVPFTVCHQFRPP